jgi:predicted acyl esterase
VRFSILFPTVLLFAGCLAAPFPAASVAPLAAAPTPALAPDIFSGLRFLSFDTVSSTGDVVHAEAWIPTTPLANATNAPTRFPAILIASPYWGGGTGGQTMGYTPYDYWIKAAVPRGYAVVHGDNAGNGGSGGCWDFMGPNERAATYALVEGIAKQPWSDGKVGMIGISYDGMTQIMASTQAPPHLTTVVPVEALTSSYAGLYMNGVHYGGGWDTTTTIYTESSVLPPIGQGTNPTGFDSTRLPGYEERLAETPACAPSNLALANDPTGADNAYYQDRDYRTKASAIKASVFLVEGFYDPAVKPDNAWPFFNEIQAPKKAWFGFWFHQFPNASASGRSDMYPTLQRWFDHTLLGIDNGIDKEPVVDVQDSLGEWRHETTWPPPDAEPATWFLGSGTVAPSPQPAGTITVGLPSGAPSGTPSGSAVAVTTLAGPPLPSALHIAGRPAVNLTLTPRAAGGYVVVRLYDRNPAKGTDRMIDQGIQNFQTAANPMQAAPVVPGSPIAIGFQLYPTDAVLLPGHALVMTLANEDGQSWWDPSPYAAPFTVTTGGAQGSSLTLPLIERSNATTFLVSCGESVAPYVPTCYHAGLKDVGVPN